MSYECSSLPTNLSTLEYNWILFLLKLLHSVHMCRQTMFLSLCKQIRFEIICDVVTLTSYVEIRRHPKWNVILIRSHWKWNRPFPRNIIQWIRPQTWIFPSNSKIFSQEWREKNHLKVNYFLAFHFFNRPFLSLIFRC